MAYLVSYRGLTVTCDDANEVDQLADRIGRKPPPPSSIREAVSKIGASGRQLLKELGDQQTPVPQSLLAKRMNLTEVQLPGVITAISKRLKSAGLEMADVLSIVVPNGSGGERMYSLVEAAIAEVKKALEEQ